MQTSERELKSLLLKGLAGDNAAYGLFLGKVSTLLRQFVSRRLFRLRRSAQDNEDIVQEALIAIHTKRNTYDGETPVTAWIYGIARYKLIDSLRTSKADVNFVDLDEMAGAAEDTQESDARLIVHKAMSVLPDTLRVPVELVKLQGLSAGEAALQTGTSEVTVRVNVHRGLKVLARYCGAHGARDEDR